MQFPWPAIFTTARSCPCGHYGHPSKECTCSIELVGEYRQPLYAIQDFLDMAVETAALATEKIMDPRQGEPWATVQERVEQARWRQQERGSLNAWLDPGAVLEHCLLYEAGQALMRSALRQLNLSARGYHRVLKAARTTADLAGSAAIQVGHLAEGIQYRPRLPAM